eukprot:COSAG02_NODE_1613_length_11675_cov_8.562716_5_plen_446_part_00
MAAGPDSDGATIVTSQHHWLMRHWYNNRREYVAGLAAATAVAWVDTPLMVLARFKQQFPQQSYVEHARGLYAARGALGFYAAGHGLHNWGRPNYTLSAFSPTVGVVGLSSWMGVAVLGSYTLLRRVFEGFCPRDTALSESVRGLAGGALCGGVAGCVGALFSLPRDLLQNLCLASEARTVERRRVKRVLTSRRPLREQWQDRGIAISWLREGLHTRLLGQQHALGSQREAMAAVLRSAGGVRILLRGWQLHLAQAALFHGSGFAAYELLTGRVWNGPYVLREARTSGEAAGCLLACGVGALAACPFEAAKVRVHAQIQPLPPAETSSDALRQWLAQSLRDAEKQESKSLLAALTEEHPSQYAVRRAGAAAVLPSRAVSMASDGCIVVPPAPPSQSRVWFDRLPVRSMFGGGAITCSRAIIYHLLLGLSFEAAIGAVEPLDFTSDL